MPLFGTSAVHNNPTTKKFAVTTDTILFYSGGRKINWENITQPPTTEQASRFTIPSRFGLCAKDSRELGPNAIKQDNRHVFQRKTFYEYEWNGYKGTWKLPKSKIEKLAKEDRLFLEPNKVSILYRLSDFKIKPSNLWLGPPRLRGGFKENCGYPTQKPIELLRQIILATTQRDEWILDPFCGSGTALLAAKELDRNYIGVDISKEACMIASKRLEEPNNGKLPF